MKFTQEELTTLIVSMKASKDIITFKRGFRQASEDEKKQTQYYEGIIKKLESLR